MLFVKLASKFVYVGLGNRHPSQDIVSVLYSDYGSFGEVRIVLPDRLEDLVNRKRGILVLPNLTRMNRTKGRKVAVLVEAEVGGSSENDLRTTPMTVSHDSAKVRHCPCRKEEPGLLAKH